MPNPTRITDALRKLLSEMDGREMNDYFAMRPKSKGRIPEVTKYYLEDNLDDKGALAGLHGPFTEVVGGVEDFSFLPRGQIRKLEPEKRLWELSNRLGIEPPELESLLDLYTQKTFTGDGGPEGYRDLIRLLQEEAGAPQYGPKR